MIDRTITRAGLDAGAAAQNAAQAAARQSHVSNQTAARRSENRKWSSLIRALAASIAVVLFGLSAGRLEPVRAQSAETDATETLETSQIETDATESAAGPEDVARDMLRAVFDADATRLAIDPGLAEREIVLAKWVDPVNYRVLGDGATREDTVATVLLAAQIEAATGLTVQPAISGRAPNLTVFIMGEDVRDNLSLQVRAALESGELAQTDPLLSAWLSGDEVDCGAHFRTDPARLGAIVEATILIKAEIPPEARARCLQRDLVRAFGLINLHVDVEPSILNPLGAVDQPTEHDFNMLRALYDPRVLPGLLRGEAETALSEMLTQDAAVTEQQPELGQ